MAIADELGERLTTLSNMLTAASRLRKIEPACVFASHSGWLLERSLGEVREAGCALAELRRTLLGAEAEHPTSPCPAYRVHFLSEFARGRAVIRACQRTVTIRSARGAEEAVEAAKRSRGR